MKNTGISRTEEYTENKAACCRLPNTATMENLSTQVSAGEGAVLKMGGKVLVTDRCRKGFIAGVNLSKRRRKPGWAVSSAA